MRNIILSISIPSYNQTEYLFAALQSISSETKNINNVEINISDNSNYYDFKKNLFNKNNLNKRINHFKSKCKSMDSNINNSINISNGEYVWIFGDDDLMMPGSLKQIIDYLNNKKPDILIVNSSSFIDEETVEKTRCKIKKNKTYSIGEEDNNIFLEEMAGYLTYIGSIIIKKNVWIKHFNSSYEGTYFSHLAVVISAKLNKKNIHYFSNPSIKMRLNSQTWTSSYFKIWNFNYPQLIWSFQSISNHSKRKVISRYPYLKISRLLSLKAYNKFNFHIYSDFFKNNKEINLFNKFIFFFIAISPRKIISLLYYIYIILIRNNHTHNFSPSLAKKLLKL